ncbi:hypothetical protein ACOME3_004155 [Neoechinorhynchus agilis]
MLNSVKTKKDKLDQFYQKLVCTFPEFSKSLSPADLKQLNPSALVRIYRCFARVILNLNASNRVKANAGDLIVDLDHKLARLDRFGKALTMFGEYVIIKEAVKIVGIEDFSIGDIEQPVFRRTTDLFQKLLALIEVTEEMESKFEQLENDKADKILECESAESQLQVINAQIAKQTRLDMELTSTVTKMQFENIDQLNEEILELVKTAEKLEGHILSADNEIGLVEEMCEKKRSQCELLMKIAKYNPDQLVEDVKRIEEQRIDLEGHVNSKRQYLWGMQNTRKEREKVAEILESVIEQLARTNSDLKVRSRLHARNVSLEERERMLIIKLNADRERLNGLKETATNLNRNLYKHAKTKQKRRTGEDAKKTLNKLKKEQCLQDKFIEELKQSLSEVNDEEKRICKELEDLAKSHNEDVEQFNSEMKACDEELCGILDELGKIVCKLT